ncbi:MAG: thiol:disulfide interchange protein DsbA/DsbL [Lysobacterales bacterium]
MKKFATMLLCGLLMAPVSSAFAQNMVERFSAGQHYFPIAPAVPSTAPAGKVEVVEAFSYACIHCAHFNPSLETWKKTKPAAAQLVLMPVVFNASWELFARAYYAAEALGALDKTHAKMFNAIFIEKKQFRTMEDIAKWYATQGVNEAKFLATAKSFGVNAKIKRSTDLSQRYQVDGTPTVMVAGKYRITGMSAGDYETLWQIVDFLVAKELAAHPAAPARK